MADSEGENRLAFVKEDTANIGSYGERSIEIDNKYIDNADYAEWMAEYLLMVYSNPYPNVSDVVIMGDPRLEVGDRITLTDSSGATGIDTDFWVTGMDWSITPLYTQALTLAYAAENSFFILDHATNGRLDFNVLAF